MKNRYYKNKNAQTNGDHEVHNEDCRKLPAEGNREYLGSYDNCKEAVDKAKETDPSADGCVICSPECHNR